MPQRAHVRVRSASMPSRHAHVQAILEPAKEEKADGDARSRKREQMQCEVVGARGAMVGLTSVIL